MTAGPDKRGTPTPLALHIAGAAELYESGARLAPLAASERFPWAGAPSPAERALAKSVASAPQETLAIALRAEAASRLAVMAKGVRLYQRHGARRVLNDPPCVWSDGGSRLLDFGGPGAPVFVTPSLINQHHILDLDEGASLLRWLQGEGFRPLLLAWGAPDARSAAFDLGDHVERRLAPAFDAALAETGAARMPVIGYCMGGALIVALATLRRAAISRLAFIGAPWDFSEMTPMRAALASLGVPGNAAAIRRMIDDVETSFGVVPNEAMEAVFARLDPGLASRKFRRFASLDQGCEEARCFVLVEDWLNDGPPLAAPAAREGLIDWHLRNAPMRGAWRVGGRAVDPADVDAPSLIVAARRDRITPPLATEALAAQLADSRVLAPDCGHVGMIVGRDAMAQLWRPLASFLKG